MKLWYCYIVLKKGKYKAVNTLGKYSPVFGEFIDRITKPLALI